MTKGSTIKEVLPATFAFSLYEYTADAISQKKSKSDGNRIGPETGKKSGQDAPEEKNKREREKKKKPRKVKRQEREKD